MKNLGDFLVEEFEAQGVLALQKGVRVGEVVGRRFGRVHFLFIISLEWGLNSLINKGLEVIILL
jgi:hypothetical protein